MLGALEMLKKLLLLTTINDDKGPPSFEGLAL